MASVRNRGSTAELAVRRRLWLNGIRYRLHVKLPGKPDLVFQKQRIAVFIDGDLWHGNSWRVRGLASLEAQFPSRTDWWVSKIRRNMARDLEVNEALAGQGWTVLRFWESDVLEDPNAVMRLVVGRVDPSRLLSLRDMPLTDVERRRRGSIGRGMRTRRHSAASSATSTTDP